MQNERSKPRPAHKPRWTLLPGLLLVTLSCGCVTTPKAVVKIPPRTPPELSGEITEACAYPQLPESETITQGELLALAVEQAGMLVVCERKRAGAVAVARQALNPPEPRRGLRGLLPF